MCRKLLKRHAAKADRPLHRTDQAAQSLHQCRLAGAVRAEHGDGFAAAYLQADLVEYRKRSITGIEPADIEQGRPSLALRNPLRLHRVSEIAGRDGRIITSGGRPAARAAASRLEPAHF